MLRRAKDFQGLRIHAAGGDVGHVEQFFFDDTTWIVRYLVVDTGTRLAGRRVLVSPADVGRVDWGHERLHVALTREQVENGPDVDTHKPISRRREIEHVARFSRPFFVGGMGALGGGPYPGAWPRASALGVEGAVERAQAAQDDAGLRSTREVGAYGVRAEDGAVGHVEGFLVDDESWTMRYLVVATRNWWPGKAVLVSPAWIERVSWKRAEVLVNLPKKAIAHAPGYDRAAPLTGDYLARVYEYYERQSDRNEV